MKTASTTTTPWRAGSGACPTTCQNLTWVGGAFDLEVFDPGQVSFGDPQQRWSVAFGEVPKLGSKSTTTAGAVEDPWQTGPRWSADLPDAAFAHSPFPRDCTRYLSMLRERRPLKLTQAGNLPRRFVTELWEAGVLTEDASWFPDTAPRNEGDSLYLPLVSAITAHSGLTLKRHGKLVQWRAEGGDVSGPGAVPVAGGLRG